MGAARGGAGAASFRSGASLAAGGCGRCRGRRLRGSRRLRKEGTSLESVPRAGLGADTLGLFATLPESQLPAPSSESWVSAERSFRSTRTQRKPLAVRAFTSLSVQGSVPGVLLKATPASPRQLRLPGGARQALGLDLLPRFRPFRSPAPRTRAARDRCAQIRHQPVAG